MRFKGDLTQRQVLFSLIAEENQKNRENTPKLGVNEMLYH
jgi:hypothetical protein